MRQLKHIFENNRQWADGRRAADPDFFKRLTGVQSPKYMWIGCADSRIPANQVIGLDPGHVFVHRNVANLVHHTDFNCLSVLQYAVEMLKVEHVIVCGHYGCGGVKAAMEKTQLGLVDNWLRNIRDVYSHHKSEIDAIQDQQKKYDKLVELNVIRQTLNVCHTTIVQNAWARGQKLCVHGWVYALSDGLLRDLDCVIDSPDQIDEVHRVHGEE
ncbi:MAG TPA: carbonate dehydratase [Planctomycetota bacterium]|nr:carbonate dehydratase [Planctomycetota bacterium]